MMAEKWAGVLDTFGFHVVHCKFREQNSWIREARDDGTINDRIPRRSQLISRILVRSKPFIDRSFLILPTAQFLV